jgi:riboflavin synthase
MRVFHENQNWHSRYDDMGAIAIDELKKNFPDVEYVRRTVPGIKDLPVECKRLLETQNTKFKTS